MPVVWMLNLLGYEIPRSWRLTFLDWQISFWELCDAHKTRVFLLGGESTVVNRFIDEISEGKKNIELNGHHGYFHDDQNQLIIDKINAFETDILLVGMGMPKQEIWIKENQLSLRARVIMPIGGYFDYIAGNTYTPPRWSGKVGMEWFFRLIADPKKLTYRYLVTPWPVFFSLLRELWKK